jgi:hypothetical protein
MLLEGARGGTEEQAGIQYQNILRASVISKMQFKVP